MQWVSTWPVAVQGATARWIWASVLIAVAAPVVAGCHSKAETALQDPVVLSIGYAAPAGPTGQVEGVGEIVSELSTEGLIRIRADGRYTAELAERWEFEAGGRRLRLYLRPDVQFHDGGPLTPEVVKASLDEARTSPRERFEYPLLADIEHIEVAGPRELVLSLRQASPLVLEDLAVRIPHPESRLGTGPFALESESPGLTTLRANPHYYRGRPRIDRIEIRTYPTVRTAWAAMMRADIDFLFDVPITARDFVERESTVRVFAVDRPYAYALLFNMNRPMFRDPRVRKALNMAVDRSAIIGQGLSGYGRPASGIWPLHWAYANLDLIYRYDPLQADRLLSSAGFGPAPASSEAGEFASRLRLTCLVPENLPPFERVGLVLQRQLYEIGIDLHIEAVPLEQIEARMDEFDAVLLWRNTGRGFARLYRYWHSSQTSQTLGYRGADRALDALRLASDDRSLQRAAAAFQRALYDDPPAVFLALREGARAVSRRFEVPAGAGQDIIETIWQWRLADGRVAE